MTIPRVEWPDPELWLCDHIRTELADATVTVTNEWPEPLPAGRVVIVRYDGGTQESYVTEESLYGFTILAALTDKPKKATDIARQVRSIVGNCFGVDGPFAACRRTSGPVRVPNTQRAERYFTAALVTVATAA